MVSGQLVHLIETHWDEIMSRAIQQLHREIPKHRSSALLESGLRERGEILLQNLGHWLSGGNEEELARKYEHFGKIRFEEDIPLHEAVHAQCLMREKILDFVEEHVNGAAGNDLYNLDLYNKEQLERRLGRFFDVLTTAFVRGYEHAMRQAALARV